MNRLRLVADDLTGALDAAVSFARPEHPVPVYFSDQMPAALPPACAIDLGTRDQPSGEAAAAAARSAVWLMPAPGSIAFKKVDSQLRGHTGAELAAILRTVSVPACVIAPAFPFHGRVTRGGRQFAREGAGWRRVGEDLEASLTALGWAVHRARAGEPVPSGVSLWDVETDEDLRRIVAAARRLPEPVLWCGSGGLAAAVAGPGAPILTDMARPILGLFGSDHPTTAAQLLACGDLGLILDDGADTSARRLQGHLAERGIALARFALPAGLTRGAAAESIAREIAALVSRVPPPGTVLVAGGETLRALARAVGADHVEVQGQAHPGVPVSAFRGGRWSGVRIVSKSGAFGGGDLLQQILALDPALVMRNPSP